MKRPSTTDTEPGMGGVADIALACGFHDHSALTRTFRAVIGVTPTQFRAG